MTMYNENEADLQFTLSGFLHNYNCLKVNAGFTKDDFVVVVICDGYERIPESLKVLAREKGFLDEQYLIQEGFMEIDDDRKFKMKNMRDVMNVDVPDEKVPSNLLHCF